MAGGGSTPVGGVQSSEGVQEQSWGRVGGRRQDRS